MVPSPSVESQEYKASLKAKRTLNHAFSYLVRDPDASRLVATAMLQQETEHRQRFGGVKHHQCKACPQYYSNGSDRPKYPRRFVPVSTRNSNVIFEMRRTDPSLPPGLLIALEWEADRLFGGSQRGFKITLEILHFVWIGSESCCGVFGAGPDGWCEWFIWDPSIPAKLQTSNAGYGCPASALRNVLNAIHEKGDL